jgi:hypothetical protein
MSQIRVAESAVKRSVAQLALIAGVCLGSSSVALAADHKISSQSGTFECKSINPGDTLTLASGTRGPLTIRNCSGASANPIIIRNDPDGSGPTVIRRGTGSTGGFILNCFNCIGVEIDGSYKWRGAPAGKTYGIKVTMTGGAGPSAFVRIGGMSRFVTIRNVEIDGAWPAIANFGVGIRLNDLTVRRSKYPGLWREGILIEDNYIHDIANSGMYIGGNYDEGGLPLRNIEIRFNRVEDTGFEGINTNSMWAGDNSIHHNEIRRAGKNGARTSMAAQYSGIKNIAGTVKIYNNWVESTGQHGIQVWTQEGPKASEGKGPFEAHIWNNVIVDAGALWRPFMLNSYGIHVGAQPGCEKPVPNIYNNTVVNPRRSGIHVTDDAGAGIVRDNIVAGAGSNPIIVVPNYVRLINNRVGTVTQMAFKDAQRQNFRLTVNSPARNQGGDDFPNKDFDDVTRPKDGAADQGAFEGTSSQ